MKKNKKMFLALAVVAALAFVSVAGISLQSDDSAAADHNLGLNDDYTSLAGSGDYNYKIDTNFKYQVNANIDVGLNIGYLLVGDESYTGTINLGYMEDGKFVVLSSMTFNNVTNVSIMLIAVWSDSLDASFALISVGNIDQTGEKLPSGTFELTEGNALVGTLTPGLVKLILDAVDAGVSPDMADILALVTPFNGTIKAGDLEVTTEYVVGTLLTSDGYYSLGAISPNEILPVDENGDVTVSFEERTLSISGTGSLQFPEEINTLISSFGIVVPQVFYVDSVQVTIEDGAEITVGDKMPTLGTASVTLNAADITAGIDVAILVDSKGNITDYTGNTATDVQFVVELNKTYTAIIVADGHIYAGSFSTNGSETTYTVSLGSNLVSGSSYVLPETIFTADDSVDPKTIAFDTATYYFLDYSMVINLSEMEVGTYNSTTKKVELNAYTSGDTLLILLNHQANNALGFYYGDLSAPTTVNSVFATTSAAPSDGQIKSSGTVDVAPSVSYFVLDGSANMTVKGTIHVKYTNDDVLGALFNNGSKITIEDDGVIEYEVKGAEFPVEPTPYLGDITAAYYYKNEGSGSDIKSTYYYTTLKTAVENSDTILLIGKHIILGEVTLDGSNFDNIKVTIVGNGSLQIGQKADPANDIEAESGTLNIPSNIKIVGNPTQFYVEYGKAVFDTTGSALPEFPPGSDVRIISETKITYADLATGLDVAVSGDTIELARGNVELVADANVKAGVVFNDKDFSWTIPDKLTMEVNGELISTGAVTITGTLKVYGKATFVGDTNEAILNGTIYVGPDGTLDVGTSAKGGIWGSTYGIMTVDGTVNLGNKTGSRIWLTELYLYGTVNNLNTTNNSFSVNKYIVIGKEPTLSTDLSNSAVFEGKLNLSGGYALIYGDFDYSGLYVGAAIPANYITTEFLIGDNWEVYATQVAINAAISIEYLFASDLKDLKLKAWYLNPLLSGPILEFGSTTQKIGAPAKVYGDFEPRMYTVTLSYTAGVNWVANGLHQGTSKDLSYAYGTEVSVYADVLQGYAGTPVLKKDGSAYNAGTKFIVTDNTVFTIDAGSVHVAEPESDDDGGLSLIEILLIIIVIIIAVIALVVALKLLRS